MKHYKLIIAGTMAAVLLSGCHVEYKNEITSEGEVETKANDTVIKFTYTDDEYTDYFKYCKEQFEKQNKNVIIKLDLNPDMDGVTDISDNTINNNDVSDVYMTGSNNVGIAVLSGIAQKNTHVDEYSPEDYCDTAINACTYNNSVYGYPLGFDTTFLAYNKNFKSAEYDFSTIKGIKNYADNADFTSENAAEIENIFMFDVNQIFYSYGWLGAYMNIGGKCGDNSSDFSVYNSDSISASVSYLSLIDYFNVTDSVSVDSCMDKFKNSKIVLSVFSTEYLDQLVASEINYGIIAFPDYDETYKTAPLSITSVLLVNQYTEHPDIASNFADFATRKCADKFYELTGELSTKKIQYENPEFSGIYDSYAKSVSKNKFIYGEQVYPLIEIAMHNITEGASASEELMKIDDYMADQLK